MKKKSRITRMAGLSKPVSIMLLSAAAVLSGCAAQQALEMPPPELMARPVVIQPIGPKAPAKSVSKSSAGKPLPLPTHERLTYALRWIGIPVGTVTASIDGVRRYEGREVYVFRLAARSNFWLSRIYRIDSTIVSYADAEHLETLRTEVNRKEGHYRKHAVIEYDQKSHVARFHSFTNGSSKSFPIPPGVRDGLTAVYYFRTLPLKPGDRIHFQVVVSESVYQFYADVIARREIGVGPFGRQAAVLVKPYAYEKGKRVEKGTMIGYFAPGRTHVPFFSRIRAALFTSATATLEKVSYGSGDRAKR